MGTLTPLLSPWEVPRKGARLQRPGSFFLQLFLRVFSWSLRLRGLRPASGFLVDGGEIAALQDIVAACFFADIVQHAMCLGVVARGFCLVAAEAKRLRQQVVALGQQCF